MAAARLIGALLLALGLLAACEARPTPFPVDLPPSPTPTTDPADAPTDPPPLRAALPVAMGASAPAAPIPDLLIDYYEADPPLEALGPVYALIIATGPVEGAQQVTLPGVLLRLNSARSPFDDPAVVAAVEAHFAPDADLRAAREALANAGWPDGFELLLNAADTPALAAVVDQLERLNIDARTTAARPADHMNLWLHTEATEPPSASFTRQIIVSQITLSYWASPDIEVRFSAQGWPQVTHR